MHFFWVAGSYPLAKSQLSLSFSPSLYLHRLNRLEKHLQMMCLAPEKWMFDHQTGIWATDPFSKGSQLPSLPWIFPTSDSDTKNLAFWLWLSFRLSIWRKNPISVLPEMISDSLFVGLILWHILNILWLWHIFRHAVRQMLWKSSVLTHTLASIWHSIWQPGIYPTFDIPSNTYSTILPDILYILSFCLTF